MGNTLCFEAKGLNAPAPLFCVGVNAGLEGGGGGPPEVVDGEAPEYLDPDASATFWTIDSGVRSRSDRAVICTW